MVITDKSTTYRILQCDNPACEHRESKQTSYYDGNPPMDLELFPEWHFGSITAVAISISGSVLPARMARNISFHACCPDCIPEAIAEVIRAKMEDDGIGMYRKEVNFTAE